MPDIVKLQTEYEKLYGKNPAPAYKGNMEWLIKKIDEAMENGVDEVVEAEAKEPIKQNSSVKTPVEVTELGEDLQGQGLSGKFYSGEWEIFIDGKGVSSGHSD